MEKIGEAEIKKILKERKILYGFREAKKALKAGKVENIIVANETFIKEFKGCIEFEGDQKQLGLTCGKPFGISVITVLKEK